MARPDLEALHRIFEQVLHEPPELRAARLDRLCREDRALRDEIASLLAAHDASEDYFARLGRHVLAPALLAVAGLPDDELHAGDMVSRYEIVGRIGSGGMGIVYVAIDRTLDRRVALKFLPPHLNADATARARFLAEARAASRLDHPHIGVIHETGESADGRPFIAMALYDGETLERRLARGPLMADEASALARQIAGALAAAHRKGVVHRDVKPANVLITPDGVVKLLDFGIAMVAGAEPAGGGAMPGTPAYMSPEQARGTTVDHRTDLWSLGVVLAEMLTGERPFQSLDDRALLHAIQHDAWTPEGRRQDLPEALEQVIRRCLEKDPRQRYSRAEDVTAELDAFAAAGTPHARREPSWPPARMVRRRARWYAAIAALSAVLLGATLHRSPGEPHWLAVLPLDSIGADPADRAVADGFTAELITALSRVDGLRVIARPSVLSSREEGRSLAGIARDLNVRSLIEGSVDATGDRVQLTVRLVGAASQEPLWAGQFETSLGELPDVQRQIVQRVAAVLTASGGGDGRGAAARAGTSTPEAYEEYFNGRHFLAQREEAAARKARQHFHRALNLDPRYAQAWSGLSDTLDLFAWLSIVPPHDAYPLARAAAEHALDIDQHLPEAHVSLARALFRHEFAFEAAAEHLRRAIALNPSHAEARQLYGIYLRMRRRFDQALEQLREAARLDPLSPAHQIEMGVTLYAARRYGDALVRYQRVLDMQPEFTAAYFFMALVHTQQEDYAEAVATLDRATPAVRWQDRDTLRAAILALMGDETDARRRLREFECPSMPPVTPWHPAILHLVLGEHDRALDLLEQAYDERSWQIPLLPIEPLFDPLRAHPRFVALLARLDR